MRIHFITASRFPAARGDGRATLGGVGWYRCGLPGRELRRHGHEVVITGPSKPWAAASPAVDADVVVITAMPHPWVLDYVLAARRPGQAVVCDVDDHWWRLDRRHVAYARYHGTAGSPEPLSCLDRALSAASAITCSTPALMEYLRGFGRPCYLLRNAIDLERWTPRPVRDHVATVGWIGAVPFRCGDLEKLVPVVPNFLERHDLRFVHVGHWPGFPRLLDRLPMPVTRVEEVMALPIDAYPGAFGRLDIAVVPQRFVEFNRAKSAVKALELSAAGVPFVADATDEYRRLGAGLLCRTKRQWERALEALLDPDRRRAEQKRNLARAQAEDIRSRWRDWADAYAEILDQSALGGPAPVSHQPSTGTEPRCREVKS